ncbi:MAG: patatin-like phospholipase family protein [Proteobacteria bacterium]|nr:patatin-like phospholipase family protein [Pseudomonadota bacterium]
MTSQAQVHTGYIYPSAGVRILIPLVVAAFMEEASRESMHDMADYNIGVSVGSVAAAAFSISKTEGNMETGANAAKDVLLNTFVTAYLMFNRNPGTIMINNVWRDIVMHARTDFEALRPYLTGVVGRNVMAFLESRIPREEDTRYDPSILEATLRKKFGDAKISDPRKAFFIIAHGMNDKGPVFFSNVVPDDAQKTAKKPLFLNRTPVHRDLSITDAILAATAIPGFIGYRHLGGIEKHFMDPGSFAVPSFFSIMRDMHDIFSGQALADHETRLSARPTWKRVAGALAKAEAPPEIISRAVYLGIGDEAGLGFDASNERGVVTQAGDIVRAASDHVRGQTFAQIATRFDDASRRVTGAPGFRIIDSSIVPQTPQEEAIFPSSDIKDGQLSNLLKLLAFGRHVVMQNADAICDEICLRMRALEARGLRTADETQAVIHRLERFRTPEAAGALCDKILVREEEVVSLFEHHGVQIPKAPEPAQKSQSGGWISGIGGGMRRVASFVV